MASYVVCMALGTDVGRGDFTAWTSHTGTDLTTKAMWWPADVDVFVLDISHLRRERLRRR
jgi:hypothetical protein